jgi:hypothetical protein
MAASNSRKKSKQDKKGQTQETSVKSKAAQAYALANWSGTLDHNRA